MGVGKLGELERHLISQADYFQISNPCTQGPPPKKLPNLLFIGTQSLTLSWQLTGISSKRLCVTEKLKEVRKANKKLHWTA